VTATPAWNEFRRRRTIGAIAFDLDMTLVDSRPVSERALERLVSEYGVHLGFLPSVGAGRFRGVGQQPHVPAPVTSERRVAFEGLAELELDPEPEFDELV
jgi:beta-phosphoglucomutase-like phosphatase (HAD superfamily)